VVLILAIFLFLKDAKQAPEGQECRSRERALYLGLGVVCAICFLSTALPTLYMSHCAEVTQTLVNKRPASLGLLDPPQHAPSRCTQFLRHTYLPIAAPHLVPTLLLATLALAFYLCCEYAHDSLLYEFGLTLCAVMPVLSLGVGCLGWMTVSWFRGPQTGCCDGSERVLGWVLWFLYPALTVALLGFVHVIQETEAISGSRGEGAEAQGERFSLNDAGNEGVTEGHTNFNPLRKIVSEKLTQEIAEGFQ
jgi:hypothetical protein